MAAIPASIHFCEEVGLDYVSCSPFRVPIARLAAAQAVITNGASIGGHRRMVEIVSHLHHKHITVVAGLCTAIEIDALQARREAIRATSETIM